MTGSNTKEEQQQLDLWAGQSKENMQALEDYKQIWKESRSSQLPEFNTISELKKLETRIDQEEKHTQRIPLSVSFMLKVAASIALFITLSFFVYQWSFKPEMIVMESGAEKMQVPLPDGSTVWLNERSTIKYTDDFNDVRAIQLTGEGYFEVTHNPEKPFVIKTDKGEVTVLGTAFNVRAYESEEQNEVYVVTGKVSLSDKKQTIYLRPGEEGILNKQTKTLTLNSTIDQNLIAWKTKQLIFKRTSLSEVAIALEKYFQISIAVKNPELKKCRFTSTFQDPTLDEVIEAISIALNLNIIHQNKHYTFDGEGC